MMAAEKFNSFGGFSVGIPPVPVIDSTGNFISNVNTSGNVTANVVFSQSYKYANGVNLVSGTNTQVQFNNNGALGSSPGFVFDSSLQKLTVSNFDVSGNTNLGSIANLKISGGLNGYFLQTDGTGNLTWALGGSGGNGSPGGSNAQIQFNDNGSFGGDVGFSYDKNTNTMSVENVGSTRITSVSANITTANINLAVANNVNVANTINSAILNTTGNVNVGNRLNANTISSITGNTQFIGNILFGYQSNVTISALSNLKIPGGNNGYFLQTDGAGNLAWSAAGGGNGSPGGSNTQVQFNKTGTFAGSPFFTFNDSTNTLQIAGKLVANSIQMGAGIYRYSETNLIESTTSSTSASQVIYSFPAASVTGIDFEVTASSTNKLNTFMLSSQLNGTSVDFTEYGGIYSNGSVGDFDVVYNPGDIITQPAIEVLVTPTSSSTTTYRLLATVYYE